MNLLARAALRLPSVTRAVAPLRPAAAAPAPQPAPVEGEQDPNKPAGDPAPPATGSEDDMAAREAALAEREAALDAREAAIIEREAELEIEIEPAPEDGEETDGMEMSGGRGARIAAARSRERARCQAIITHPKASANPGLAAHLAFGTPLTRGQAICALDAGGGAAPAGLAGRMAAHASPRPTASAPTLTRGQAITSSWDRAFKQIGR